MIDETIKSIEPFNGPLPENARSEYGRHYRELVSVQKPASLPSKIEVNVNAPQTGRQDVVMLGAAGQRILTAGEVLGIAGLTAGLNVTQKNEYNITVMTGPSISELILSPEEIDYTGIVSPTAVIALAPEGVERRKELFAQLKPQALVIQVAGVEIPPTQAQSLMVDFKAQSIKKTDWAMAALATLAGMNRVLNPQMLHAALIQRFRGRILETVKELVDSVIIQNNN